MYFIFAKLGLLGIAASAIASETQYFLLKTKVQPGQTGKEEFNSLFLSTAETEPGGEAFAILSRERLEDDSFFHLQKSNHPPVDGHDFYNIRVQQATFEDDAAYMDMNIQDLSTASWQPVGYITARNANFSRGGFWVNSTGLQWTDVPANPNDGTFQGWLVCDWWFENPQLFYVGYNGIYKPSNLPSSCAHVDLMPIPLTSNNSTSES